MKGRNKVLAATKDYHAEQDLLGAFLAERRLQGPNYQAKASVLYGGYKDGCEQCAERLVFKALSNK
jgi:hypothetical protein